MALRRLGRRLRGLRPRSVLGAGSAASLLIGGGLLTGILRAGPDQLIGRPRIEADMPASAMDLAGGPANNSPTLLSDPTEDRFVVMANRIDAPDFGCALQVSGDGGRSWIAAPATVSLPAGAEKCYAPELAFDRNGVLFYLFVGLAGRGNRPMGVFLAKSTDRARTFAPARQVLGPNNFSARMAVDRSFGANGRMHLVWLHAETHPGFGLGPPPNPILASYSDDGGTTFSEPVQVSDRARSRVIAPALALAPDNTVHVAYYDLGDDIVDYQALEGPRWEGRWSVVLASSADGGRHFGRGRVVDGSVAAPERVMLIFTMPPPSLTAEARTVCVGWTDARHGDPDALARCRSNSDWGPLRRLNDDPIGNGHRQYLPRLSVAASGRVDAVFYDRREDPQNRRNHVFYTYSTDGGRHFAPNMRLTNRSSDSSIGARYAGAAAAGQVENGGRLGLLSRPDGATVAWPDSRNYKKGTGQDLFTTQVALVYRHDQPAAARWAGMVLVALGGLGLWRTTRRKHWRAVVAGVATVAGAGCTPTAKAVLLPPAPHVVDVTMRDHRFEYDPDVPPGRVVFRVRNAGRLDHELGLYPIGDDFPPIDVQLHGPERRPITPFGRVPTLAPGEDEAFAVDLAPNRRYAMICFLRDPDGHQHDQKGMNSEFRPEAQR